MGSNLLKKVVLLFFLLVIVGEFFAMSSQNESKSANSFAIVVHGGAGTYSREKKYVEEVNQAINLALERGYKILEEGGSSIDAVVEAIKILEDCPLFNAGIGSALNDSGFVEMDASIMEGKDLRAGAVAGVRNFKNPIILARLVMEKTPHLFFAGEGIDNLIKKFNLDTINPEILITPEQKKRWSEQKSKTKGTVGAVALDKYGNIAAGTSTGGYAGKMVGRIGDSPVIGAGTYAKNSTCGISCTGLGEFFIRQSAAFQVSALMEFKNYNLESSVKEVLKKIFDMGATGGIIGIDKDCNIVMEFTTLGMPSGYIKSTGEKKIILFKTEK
ncbi:MAG: isoaspartyl peptidase/L-asparaginase [Ignavibacteria bacterium]|nr:isoaspartyl peptidase/L-asparaginase [Ignavibacteria bacterium]